MAEPSSTVGMRVSAVMQEAHGEFVPWEVPLADKFDSLEMLDLVVRLENEFDIQLSEHELMRLPTLRSVADYIEAELATTKAQE